MEYVTEWISIHAAKSLAHITLKPGETFFTKKKVHIPNKTILHWNFMKIKGLSRSADFIIITVMLLSY